MKSKYYRDKYKQGKRYEDFASDKLYEWGLPMKTYSSYEYQLCKGESRARIEIKNDDIYKTSNNLYFETHEKKGDEWVESGILRKDNTVFYFIGDYDRAWLFSKKQLFSLINNNNFEEKLAHDDQGNVTGKGVVIPIEYFNKRPNVVIQEFNFIDQNINHIPCID